jgi:hypothetical protein
MTIERGTPMKAISKLSRHGRLVATLKDLERRTELLASAMRDTRRTGGWKGAEEVARAFDRINATCASALALDRASEREGTDA